MINVPDFLLLRCQLSGGWDTHQRYWGRLYGSVEPVQVDHRDLAAGGQGQPGGAAAGKKGRRAGTEKVRAAASVWGGCQQGNWG